MAASKLRVELVHAWPERAWSLRLELPIGATVAEALAQAAPWLLEQIPGITLSEYLTGRGLAIFGRLVRLDSRLHDGDRIELLRPLLVDPKQARRQRARQKN